MKRLFALFLLAIVLTLLPQQAPAQTWTEVGDAGDLIGTHQVPLGNGALTTIKGMLGSADLVDIYCITVTDRTIFTATLTSSTINPLWLFDTNKNGVTCQEGFYLNTPSQITGAFVANPGTYYLAITAHDMIPGNPSAQDIWNANPRSVETAPNGTGAPGPLSSWGSFGPSFGLGSYTIALTGAAYCPESVPEPGVAAFASVVGLSGLTLFLRRRRK